MIKKTAIFGIAIVSIILIACATFGASDNKNNTKNINSTIWKNKVPELFNNVGYSKLFESNNVNNKLLSGTNQDIGKVTNPFGIRDDVLEFIINYFPNNESAVYAAIRMEQTDVSIYYAETDKEAVQISNNGEVSIWCLANNVGFTKAEEYIGNKDKMSLATLEGKKIGAEVRKKLGWKILGNHLSKEQMNAICDRRNY